MKKNLFILVLILSISTKFYASHLAGAIIRYKVINDTTRTYRLFLEITRDCNGVPLGANDNINVYCGVNCANNILNVPVTRDSIRVTSQVCNVALTTCNGGPLPGLETHYYSAIVQLPVCATKYYTFAWSSGARNSAVMNLDNPSSQNFSVYSSHKFNYVNTPNVKDYSKNTAPELLAPPSPFFYAGSKVCYSLTAIDTVDNDSIAYELVPCAGNNAAGACADVLTYAGIPPQYSFTKPFGINIPHTFDSKFGTLTFLPPPSAIGLYNFAIKIKEYRKGNLISEYIRDLQCSIIAGGTNISCDPSPQPIPPTIADSTSKTFTAECGLPFSVDLVFPSSSGGSSAFNLDSLNSYYPNWISAILVPSASGLIVRFSGIAPCPSGYSEVLNFNIKQACIPGVTIPSVVIITLKLNIVATGSLNLNAITNKNREMVFFPNPVNDLLNIETKHQEKIQSISITDASGKIVFSNSVNNNQQSISTRMLNKGLYYIHVSTDKNTYHSKLMKD